MIYYNEEFYDTVECIKEGFMKFEALGFTSCYNYRFIFSSGSKSDIIMSINSLHNYTLGRQDINKLHTYLTLILEK